jgi:predicted phage terminase large subunit-like protein
MVAIKDTIQEIISAALPILKAQNSLYEFTKLFWNVIEPKDKFVDGFHIKALCDHFEAISKGVIQDTIFNVPPRCAKSSIGCVMWPAWDWIENPWRRFIFASHKYDLAERDSIRCRDIIKSELYQKYWGHIYKFILNRNEYYENNHRGFRKISSPGSSVTGEGAHIIVADDLNDTTEVFSDKIRGSTNLWFSGTLSMRLNDQKTGAIVIIAQRSHELDVSGYAMEADQRKKITRFILPMEFEPDRKCKTVVLRPGEKAWEDPRTKPGELLWPNKMGIEEVKRMKERLRTEYSIAGQLQQRPSPEQGGIIKKTYFRWWKQVKPPKLKQVIQSWDTALSDRDMQKNAYSACTTWGIFDDFGEDEENTTGIPNIILLDCWRGKLEYPELRKMAQRLSNDYKDKDSAPKEPDGHHVPDYVLVEEKASGRPLIQDLRRAGVMAIPFIPDKFGDKTQRVRLCTPVMECGRVWLPANPFTGYKSLLPFAEQFMEQCCLFPNAESRDYVDSMSQVLLRTLYGGVLYNSNDPKRQSSYRAKKGIFYGPDKE